MTRPRGKTTAVTAAFAVWICLAFAGVLSLWTYKYSPGRTSEAAEDWPDESRLPRPADRPMLLVFVHPHCPCTPASYLELEKLLAKFGKSVDAVVVVYRPSDKESETWVGEVPIRAAKSMGAQFFIDDDGGECRRFDATTSGHAMLFSRAGRLLFSGGVTPSRGNSGDNLGLHILAEEIEREAKGAERTHAEQPRIAPVFGCPLPGGKK